MAPDFGSVVTSAETNETAPSTSGVVRWLMAGNLSHAGWQTPSMSAAGS